MFEYLNYGALGVVGFLFIIFLGVSLASKEKSFGIYFLFIFLFSLIILDANSQYNTAKSNIKEFKKGYTLKCYSGGGLYSSANTYRVELDDGWKANKDYFTKESFMVRANKCERW